MNPIIQMFIKFVASDPAILVAWFQFMVANGMATKEEIFEEIEYQKFLDQAVKQAESIVGGDGDENAE